MPDSTKYFLLDRHPEIKATEASSKPYLVKDVKNMSELQIALVLAMVSCARNRAENFSNMSHCFQLSSSYRTIWQQPGNECENLDLCAFRFGA